MTILSVAFFLYFTKVRADVTTSRPGARFSKVPVTFRAGNQIFKSKFKEWERGSWLVDYSILFH